MGNISIFVKILNLGLRLLLHEQAVLDTGFKRPHEPRDIGLIMNEKKELILALGSNYEQEKSLADAMSRLRDLFGHDIIFSKRMWTEPIGIESEQFLNCLALTHTSHKLEHLYRSIKYLERTCGDRKRARANNLVKIDIDILKYGELKLHEKDWSRYYIKELMKDCPFNDGM